MKFSINYSPEAAKVFSNDQIELDHFKTPPWSDMIGEAKLLLPVTVHFNLRAGSLREPDWAKIENYLAATSTAFVNTHLGIFVNEMPHIPANESPDRYQRQEVLERLLKSVHSLVDHFGAEQVIIENVPFRLNEDSTLRACSEPGIISQVIETTGCGLLLDVSHARISAHYLGMDPFNYIETLPVHTLRELHFTGIHDWDGYLMDHLPILDADWLWLDWVLEKINNGEWGKAHMLAFEYGGTGEFFSRFSDPDVMIKQVPRLYQACHNGSLQTPPPIPRPR